MTELEEFQRYLREMLDIAERTGSVEAPQAQMWSRFLPVALHFWTTAGVLEQIAALIAEPSEPDDEEDED